MAATRSRSLVRGIMGTLSLLVLGLLPVHEAGAVSTNIDISQVYGGGGNSGAPYQNDYVELFNRGTSTASVAGWSVQYTSATGTANFGAASNAITPLSGSLAPGQYLLVQEASNAAVGAPLPTPDVTDSTPINMSSIGAKVALVNATTPLGCNGSSTPCSPAALATIVDLIGWDGANFFEGAGPAPTTSNTTSDSRLGMGCQDTDNNGADFAIGAPSPRNTAAPLHPCETDDPPAVFSTTPDSGALNVPANAGISVTFTEAVDVTGAWYSIGCASSGSHPATVTGGPTTFVLDPTADFSNSESCTVTIVAAQVTDQDLDDPPDALTADYIWSFTTEAPPPPPVPIHDIQGSAHRSTLSSTGNTPGVVVARAANGFWMEAPPAEWDGDDATSEGIFVFTSSAPTVAVGDAVRVAGTVQEFRSGGATSVNLTTTEIAGSPSVVVLSSGNLLPPPVVVGTGGRIPPAATIEDDASGDVETSGTFDPATDGIDFYESLEGMRVQANDAVATGPTSAFSETPVIGDGGANAGVRTARGGILVQAADFNPERIILDDLGAGGPIMPMVSVGASFPGATVGVMDYSFGNFKLMVTSLPAVVPTGLTREVAAAPTSDQLSMASFNVENLSPNDPQTKFDGLAQILVNNLRSPDIVGLEEIQDNDGVVGGTASAVVDADQTLSQLIAAISAAGGPAYDYRQINPVDDQEGGVPGGNIRVAFLFRPDRVSFVDRPGGDPVTPVSVVSGPSGTELSFSPGRVDPTNTAWSTPEGTRRSLAGEFVFGGRKVFVIANHWKSKGGDQPLFGHFQPPTLVTGVQRAEQAQSIHDFVQSVLATDANANAVVLGDLNDFEFSTPLATLTAGGILHDLIETLPLDERYTYDFEGNSQTLDHILVTGNLFSRAFTFDSVHVNAEFANQLSDHDPQLLQIIPNRSPTASAGGPYQVVEGGSVALTASASDPDGGTLTYAWDLDDDGTFETPGQSVTFSAGSLTAPSTSTVKVRVTDDGGLSAIDATTVDVIYPFAGFFQPVDNLPVFNVVRAGQAVPVRFSLSGDRGLDVFAAGYPKSETITCDSDAVVDGVEETVSATSSGLSYDPVTDIYVYTWKTQKPWAGTCRQLVMKMDDGTFHRANFMLRK